MENPGLSVQSEGGGCGTPLSRTGTGQGVTQAWRLGSSWTNLVISEVLRQDGQTVGVRCRKAEIIIVQSRRMEKGKKQITHEEKCGVEQIGEDGEEWVKTAEGSVTTITFSYSEIRVEVDTP